MPLAVEAESPNHWTTREVAQPKSLLREASDCFAMWHQLHEGNAVFLEGRGMPRGQICRSWAWSIRQPVFTKSATLCGRRLPENNYSFLDPLARHLLYKMIKPTERLRSKGQAWEKNQCFRVLIPLPIPLMQGSPTSGPRTGTSCQISGGIEVHNKRNALESSPNHPPTLPSSVKKSSSMKPVP